MKYDRIILFAFFVFCLPALLSHAATVDRYDVTWETPSKDSSGSMPLGNGDIGLNGWAEKDGSLYFYISKTDAWSENARLLKLGLVRLRFSPNPFDTLKTFRHHLSLQEGTMIFKAADKNQEIVLKLWVDAHAPVIRVDMQGKQPFHVHASLLPWRTEPRTITDKQELHSAYGLAGAPFPVEVSADVVKETRNNQILWYHRNQRSIWPMTLRKQGLSPLIAELHDPLLNRTFGGLMQGKNFVLDDENSYSLHTNTSSTSHRLSVCLLTKQTKTAEAWIEHINQQAKTIDQKSWDLAYKNHEKYWQTFWERGYIHLTASSNPTSEAYLVSRGYALQRFISACAGRGEYPIKFNGSIFTVDVLKDGKQVYDADYRRWGGPYWFQNTRLCYWPMLKSGDFDMMNPFFDMFLQALPLAQKRTQLYYQHKGAMVPETMYFWGAYAMDNYGWDREGKPIAQVDNHYIRYHFNGQIELLAMMIDRYLYSQDEDFLQNTLIPFAEPALLFFDKHYPRDEKGKRQIKPSQALETWQKAVNPTPDIAGLHWVTSRLLDLKSHLPEKLLSLCHRIKECLPNVPQKSENGKTYILPAEKFDELKNSETPELYAVYPFRLFGVGKPNLDVAIETFKRRRIKRTGGWTQDPIQAAYLGLTDTARDYTVQNFSTWHQGSRFPAFWGPNFDWIPDQDHGNVSMIALQSMLMQVNGKKILLFPAWPEEWDVEFKLHAPYQTVIEGLYKNGKVRKLTVSPKTRQKDIEILLK